MKSYLVKFSTIGGCLFKKGRQSDKLGITRAIIFLFGVALLAGCGKQQETIIYVEKLVTPAPAATPHVYKLGEPRPIVLNETNQREVPRNRVVVPDRESIAARERMEMERRVAQLKREAEESARRTQEADARQQAQWRTENEKWVREVKRRSPSY